MSNLGASALLGLAVGGSLVAGALVAAAVKLPESVAATLTAFGGGALLSAVALELVPEADELAGVTLTAFALTAGTLLFLGADALLTRDDDMRAMRRSGQAAQAGRPMLDRAQAARGESIAIGLFVDGVPESLALGLTVATGKVGLALVAGVLVGNVVEAYGAAQPIVQSGHTKAFALALLGGIGGCLALTTLLGGTVLSDLSPGAMGSSEALAAGAVLAVVSVSIIPHAFEEVSSLVAAATSAGFVVGYLLT
jgi:ZIP family zinc transporter